MSAGPERSHLRVASLSWLSALCLSALSLCACSDEAATVPEVQTPAIVLTDVTSSSGLTFDHRNAASEGKLLPETMGSGVAIFDADGDSRPDVLLVDGGPLQPSGEAASGETRRLRLFRNRGALRFEDATEDSGLELPFYGMGVAVGDVDGNGTLDLFVSGVGGDRLFTGRGDGTFEDATAAWGLPLEGGFGSSAALLDGDGDGDLDLFVGRYVDWSLESDRPCSPDDRHRVYCTPEVYAGVSNLYFRNDGERFVDATEESGLALPGKALGVVVLDVDLDGHLDIAVANDTVPNFLFHNGGDGTFEEVATESGFALGAARSARGGMGIAAGDLFGEAREDVVVGNFANEMAALFHNLGDGLLEDRAAAARLGMPTLLALTFGTLAVDLDNDGRLDVVFANGHIEPSIPNITDGRESWAQPLQVFRNVGGAFEPSTGVPGEGLVARGLAAGDLDDDGDVDLVVTQNGGPAVLLRNDSPPTEWLRVQLHGPERNRWGIGAAVEIELDDGTRLLRRLEPSGSYLSSSEPILHVGLGGDDRDRTVSRLLVHWPGGGTTTVEKPGTRQTVKIRADG